MNTENRNQRLAIEYGEGPLMIIAGPGSGKTYTLTERIAYLIRERRVRPENILVLTFSREAAREMKERFEKKYIERKPTEGKTGVTFGTFHSVFYHVVKRAYGDIADKYIFGDEYQDKIRFDEMLSIAGELLHQRQDILELVRHRFTWILIDEFQDIDEVQFDIVRLIAPAGANITVVGDDDQSIYGFRGARPDIMLSFTRYYPDASRIVLEYNYRSTPQIVRSAGRLISNNKNRFKKNIRAVRQDGDAVHVTECRNAREEYDYICRSIVLGVSSGTPHEDMAVLYRNNIIPWGLMHVMDEYAIPYSHDKEDKGIRLMTYHASKGLEFSRVYLIDCNKGTVPNRLAKSQAELEEERRMFYVAMTRAKDELVILYSEKSKSIKTYPSSFIPEILML